MSATATVTGVVGPAVTLTAGVFTGISSIALETNSNKILTLYFADGRQPQMISVSAATTYTLTVSGNNFALTVS